MSRNNIQNVVNKEKKEKEEKLLFEQKSDSKT